MDARDTIRRPEKARLVAQEREEVRGVHGGAGGDVCDSRGRQLRKVCGDNRPDGVGEELAMVNVLVHGNTFERVYTALHMYLSSRAG